MKVYEVVCLMDGSEYVEIETKDVDKARDAAEMCWHRMNDRVRARARIVTNVYEGEGDEDLSARDILEGWAEGNLNNPGCVPDPVDCVEFEAPWDAGELEGIVMELVNRVMDEGLEPEGIPDEVIAEFNRADRRALSDDDAEWIRARVAREAAE